MNNWMRAAMVAIAFGDILIIANWAWTPEPPPHACPLPIASPSTGPVSVEWTHGDGRVTVNLGGTGYPIVADPGSGKRWILMPVKDD